MEHQNHEHQHQAAYACWCKEINEEMAKLGNVLKGLGPSDQVKEHFRTSKVEFLKGLRRMIDEKIESAQSTAAGPQGSTVPVE